MYIRVLITMTNIFHRMIIFFYNHYKENDCSFQRTAVCFYFLHELESLESRLFKIFGNITFGNVSIHLIFVFEL